MKPIDRDRHPGGYTVSNQEVIRVAANKKDFGEEGDESVNEVLVGWDDGEENEHAGSDYMMDLRTQNDEPSGFQLWSKSSGKFDEGRFAQSGVDNDSEENEDDDEEKNGRLVKEGEDPDGTMASARRWSDVLNAFVVWDPEDREWVVDSGDPKPEEPTYVDNEIRASVVAALKDVSGQLGITPRELYAEMRQDREMYWTVSNLLEESLGIPNALDFIA